MLYGHDSKSSDIKLSVSDQQEAGDPSPESSPHRKHLLQSGNKLFTSANILRKKGAKI